MGSAAGENVTSTRRLRPESDLRLPRFAVTILSLRPGACLSEHRAQGSAGPAPTGRSGSLSGLLEELVREPQAELGETWERWLFAGAVVGRFELVREIGRGGFGIVWEARDRELGRAVAFKAVRAGSRAALREEALLREAEAAARLSHPNLVTLHDIGRTEHGPYLVLELLRGNPLSRVLEKGALPLREAVRIGVEIAKGLSHAHAAGVVHRDLKPANVVLCDDGCVKILDFGLAHAFGRERIDGGTPGYMAPEQWRGAPEDERTDVFALGVILYRSVAGELPFRGKSSEESAPRLEVEDCPELGELVARMLAEDPVERPRNGAAALKELQGVAGLLAQGGLLPTPRVRVRRRPGPLVISALAGAVLLLVLGLLFLWLQRETAGLQIDRSVAVLPFENLSSDKNDALLADGVHSEVINQLGKVAGLKVISRSSVLPYREGKRDPKSIARDLGVATLLEGTVRRSGVRVRINAELFEASTGRQLWSEEYDRTVADTLAVQTEVAESIARVLGVELSDSEIRLLRRPPSRDAQAYDLYRRATLLFRSSSGTPSEEIRNRATEMMEGAVARDPSFALAHAWLAMAAADYAHSSPGACEKAAAESRRALELQPDLPEAHAAVGVYLSLCKHDPRAVPELRAAERGLPNDAFFSGEAGRAFWLSGEENASIDLLRRVADVDPRSFAANATLTTFALRAGRFADAARGAARERELAPNSLRAMAHEAEVAGLRDGDFAPTRKALVLASADPLPPSFSPWAFEEIAWWQPESGLDLAARVLAREEKAADPDQMVLAHWNRVLARGHFALGHLDQSRASYRKVLDLLAPQESLAVSRGFGEYWHTAVAEANAGAGHVEAALDHLRAAKGLVRSEDARDRYMERSLDVELLAGRTDASLEALDELLARRRNFTARFVRANPFYAPLRKDPRFAPLIARYAPGQAD